jgi:gamma-glutamyltranspeptidase/glutathione hydrolase
MIIALLQPLAAEAGLSILKRGGNAVDAAVGVAAALNVCQPTSTGWNEFNSP